MAFISFRHNGQHVALVPLCPLPQGPRRTSKHVESAFVSPRLPVVEAVVVKTRQLRRSLEFWRRVIFIWTSFKATQVYVALQRRHRKSDWPRRVWEAQHERAGDVRLDCRVLSSSALENDRVSEWSNGFVLLFTVCVVDDAEPLHIHEGLLCQVSTGQLVALQSFVPTIIRKKLSRLQDDMPPMSEEQARRVINEELRKLGKSGAIFESLDLKNVLGSASIAQVHRGVLRNGQVDVAVKVQFPNMEAVMMSDLANYRVLAEVLQRTELKFDLVRPVQELAKQIAMEFDFAAEARGMDEIRHALRNVRTVSVPAAIPGLVSRRLLVMTYLDGVPLTKLDGKLGRFRSDRAIRIIGRKLLKNLTACYGKMILTDGFFQADCHPGNILVRNANVDIGLLDFGQTKRFSNERRVAFARLVDAMSRRDASDVRKGLEGMGIKIVHARRPKHRKTRTRRRKRNGLTIEEELAYTMFDTAAIPGVSDNPFSADSALRLATVEKLPRDLVFLLRTMQLLRGISRSTFNADFSMVSLWGNIARAELRDFSRQRRERRRSVPAY